MKPSLYSNHSKKVLPEKMKKKASTYILAEMAASHEGDREIAEFIVDSAAKAKADGILFQIINLDTYIVLSDEDYQDVKSFYLKQETWGKLIEKANSLGLDIWANVYDLESVKFCINKKIKGFKLHSSNLENESLVQEVIKTKKELLLSVGGTGEKEIKETLDLIYSVNPKARVHLMFGLQNFPTNPEGINPSFITQLSRDLKLPFGYQDHSEPTSPASTYLPILFMAKGASIIEKHITHNRNLKWQDYESALNPDEFADFVRNIRIVDKILNKKADEVSTEELKYREYKSLMKVVAKKSIEIGEIFTENNLTVMRARRGEISGKRIKSLLDKTARSAYRKYEPIKRSELVKAGIFITARLKSQRLPRKVVKPILGKPMIEWMIDRLKRCNIDPFVMMTSTNPQDDLLIEIAKQKGIRHFRGSEDDVLLRMRDCAREFDVDLIISVTADDPLKEPIFIEQMIESYLDTGFDFCEIEGSPNGCESHAVSRTALEKVCELKGSADTEIWGPYFRETGMFRCDVIKVTDPDILRPQYRVTVDTKEDFEMVTQIFSILSKEKDYFNVYDICRLLDKRKDLVAINAHIQQRGAPRIELKSSG
jgi:sialic acid synthase SpsE/spore coat polysaccharide biosynthesis protein SpsF (cytidylyltransferase family)